MMEERSSYFKVCAVLLTIVLCFAVAANKRGTAEAADARAEAQKFIDDYTRRWNDLRTAYVLADWQSNTRIVEGDDANTRRTN
ncbi:MAG: hypothetical protein H0W45_06150, partial [Acidobacteria bacterium]|nr:hypothetical protein [Acidobacteriota bacterium]